MSAIHSAKRQEWDTVFILNLVDGCIPSDMAAAKPERIGEERPGGIRTVLTLASTSRAMEKLSEANPVVSGTHRPGLCASW